MLGSINGPIEKVLSRRATDTRLAADVDVERSRRCVTIRGAVVRDGSNDQPATRVELQRFDPAFGGDPSVQSDFTNRLAIFDNFKVVDFFARMQRQSWFCLLYTSPSPRDATLSRMPSSA